MLCDLIASGHKAPIIQASRPSMIHAVTTLGKKIAAAERFTLDRRAVMMIQNTSLLTPTKFIKALPICRMPFCRMWVEFDFKDRADWLKEAIAAGRQKEFNYELASPPKRIGFYMESSPENPHLIDVHPAWNHYEDTPEIAMRAMRVDTTPTPQDKADLIARIREALARPENREGLNLRTEADLDAGADLEWRFDPIVPPYLTGMWNDVQTMGPEFEQEMLDSSAYDLKTEWRFILAFLLIINSRNLVNIGKGEDLSKLNKARSKKGRPPLLTHRPIRLNLSRIQQQRMRTQMIGPRATPTEAVPVMGHFKVRSSGIFYWSEHERYSHLGRGEGRIRRVVA
jgi:hypothetical protein